MDWSAVSVFVGVVVDVVVVSGTASGTAATADVVASGSVLTTLVDVTAAGPFVAPSLLFFVSILSLVLVSEFSFPPPPPSSSILGNSRCSTTPYLVRNALVAYDPSCGIL